MLSQTQIDQSEVVAECLPLLKKGEYVESETISKLFKKHAFFLRKTLGQGRELPSGFTSMDSSHPWVIMWALNGLRLIGVDTSDLDRAVVETILAYQNHETGAFGGGVGQMPHMAGTYSAVVSLALCGTPGDWAKIDRRKLAAWLMRMKQPDGSFSVCEHGECDPRASYCALSVAALLNLEVFEPELHAGCAEYLRSCQTYEGGFANTPFGEAHGGYAFCSIASLCLAGNDPRRQLCDNVEVDKFTHWLALRQDSEVPGFSGRTNKLVDACYSHWVGGCWPLIEQVLPGQFEYASRQGLEDYLLKCCQEPLTGGFKDKPGKRPDGYHTNYSLCGLAEVLYRYKMGSSVFEWEVEPVQLGIETPVTIEAINPVFGTPLGYAERIREHFTRQ